MDSLQTFIEKLGLKIEMCFVVDGIVEHVLIKSSNSDCFSIYTNKSYKISAPREPSFPIANIIRVNIDEQTNCQDPEYDSLQLDKKDAFGNLESIEDMYKSKINIRTDNQNKESANLSLLNQSRRLNMCISHTPYNFGLISHGVFVDSAASKSRSRLFNVDDSYLLFLNPSIPISKNKIKNKIIVQTTLEYFYSNGNKVDSEQSDIKYKLYKLLQTNFTHMMGGIYKLESDIEYIKDISSCIYNTCTNYMDYLYRFDSVNTLMESSRLKSVLREKEYRLSIGLDSANSELAMASERAKYSESYEKLKEIKKLVFNTERDLRNRLDEIFVIADNTGITVNLLMRQIADSVKNLADVSM